MRPVVGETRTRGSVLRIEELESWRSWPDWRMRCLSSRSLSFLSLLLRVRDSFSLTDECERVCLPRRLESEAEFPPSSGSKSEMSSSRMEGMTIAVGMGEMDW